MERYTVTAAELDAAHAAQPAAQGAHTRQSTEQDKGQ